ncbi:putative Hsp70 family chaperone [Aspergillus indologenus CBS 114.80]|uniref:Putative Hsp70 family chaperone n=1 Tax=Aspergillus indologenus CBS 114.80 TaxID=1450541 RepID=A0A2V5IGK7_9EURO|nr:putative Hsp70 family chaperone [Aspergillus indologenus CBS 114.80]
MKVPSTISYEARTASWGYQVGPFTEAFRGLKLLLDEGQETMYPPSLCSKNLLAILDKDAVQVTADYLRHLIKYAHGVLERRLGIAASAMNLQFILTVPAVWSDKAKDCTLRAALKAGIAPQDVSLVSEPEAAALYSLRAIRSNSIAVCYIPSECRICGSMLLDESFQKMLGQRMGPKGYAALSDKAKEAALHYWQDRVKPNFAGKYDEDFADVDYFIPVPGALDDHLASIEDGFLYLTSEDVTSIFDPIVKEVESLVAEQIEGIKEKKLHPKAIILVGGFGASRFLFHRLQEACPSVLVMQPPDAWSAVVCGAVHRGLDGNQVESRIACRHYGVEIRIPYVEGQDNPDRKVWCPLEEQYYIYDSMRWYIKKVLAKLLFCNNDTAPDFKDNHTMQLCTLKADLSTIPRELFTQKCNSKGVKCYRIYYHLVMIPTSASLLFELEFNGVRYSSVRSKY